jgi:hypothetical protein
VPATAGGERTRVRPSPSGFSVETKALTTLGFVVAVLFAIAFLVDATSTSTMIVSALPSLLLAGLACLALPVAGHRRRLAGAAPAVTPIGSDRSPRPTNICKRACSAARQARQSRGLPVP